MALFTQDEDNRRVEWALGVDSDAILVSACPQRKAREIFKDNSTPQTASADKKTPWGRALGVRQPVPAGRSGARGFGLGRPLDPRVRGARAKGRRVGEEGARGYR